MQVICLKKKKKCVRINGKPCRGCDSRAELFDSMNGQALKAR
jgi:hypothetical protein